MNILITGGTGLIGRALCAALLRDGHALTVLSRRPQTVAAKCGPAVLALGSLAEWPPEQHFDAIINLAGEPIVDAAWTAARKQRLWDSRVSLTEQLVQRIAAARQKPAVLLSGSAIGYYGDSGDTEQDETGHAGTDFAAKLCLAWEAAAQKACPAGVRLCLLRTGLVFSADGGMLAKMRLPFALGLGARLGNGRQWMSWIHIDDYVAIVRLLLLHTAAEGAVNMTAPRPVTNAEFTAALAHALHRPAFLAAPAALLKPLLGERSVLLFGGQKVLPRKAEALGYRFAYPTLADALEALFGTTGC
ncbi:Epimerase family protein YfcH [Georgfuchsia toluolica]|uniref:Epimerase family protein YfcH n=1 Tax=Georgfuchsia toluolica TaxID=424218 RepID=A0A916J5R1_9PROT|nr:TIGR01777 family oxidoreductase [Georgfuchsia toluolica]CAG4884447.1 Epimerase family protein YfcH [Georgfuchsia toluolica]